jgi:hypothetical protein
MANEMVFQERLGKAGSFSVVLTAYYDWHTTPADWDGTTEDYLNAWRRGDISFLNLKVSCVYFGTELGEAWLGGVEYGSYKDWKATEADIAQQVINEHSWMIEDAVNEAKTEFEQMKTLEIADFVPKSEEVYA